MAIMDVPGEEGSGVKTGIRFYYLEKSSSFLITCIYHFFFLILISTLGALSLLSEPYVDATRVDAPGTSDPYVTVIASVILSLSDKEDWKVQRQFGAFS